MKKFLCTFYLPEELEESFWEEIPGHRKYINSLMDAETIVTYSVLKQSRKHNVLLNASPSVDSLSMSWMNYFFLIP